MLNGKLEKRKPLCLARRTCFVVLDRIRVSKIIRFAASC
jgi:hypothetical protein